MFPQQVPRKIREKVDEIRDNDYDNFHLKIKMINSYLSFARSKLSGNFLPLFRKIALFLKSLGKINMEV